MVTSQVCIPRRGFFSSLATVLFDYVTANLSSWLEAGKHTPWWKPCTSSQNLRLRLLKGFLQCGSASSLLEDLYSMSLLSASQHHEVSLPVAVFQKMWQTQDTDFYIIVCPEFWADYYVLICTHCCQVWWHQCEVLAASHCHSWWTWWSDTFVNDTGKVMTALSALSMFVLDWQELALHNLWSLFVKLLCNLIDEFVEDLWSAISLLSFSL